MNLKKTFFLIVLVTVCLSLWGFGNQEAEKPIQAEPVSITVAALKGPTGIGMVQLFETPPDLGPNVTAEYMIINTPDVMVAKLMKGEVDIAALPLNLAAKLYTKGIPYQLGALTGNGMLYLLTTSDEINTIADLKDKKIYNIGKGSTPELMANYILSKNGLEPQKDTILDYSFSHPDLAQALIGGIVDTAILPEPLTTMVLMKNPAARIAVDFQEEWKRQTGTSAVYPMSCVVIKKELVEQYGPAMEKYLQAYKESINWVIQNSDDVGMAVEKHNFGIKAGVIKKAVNRINYEFIIGGNAQKRVEDFLTLFLEAAPEAIGGALPDEGFYVPFR